MKLEVCVRTESETAYWVATIITTCGQLLLLRYEGYQDDRRADFWCDIMTADLHPIGWSKQQGQPMRPPEGEQRLSSFPVLSNLWWLEPNCFIYSLTQENIVELKRSFLGKDDLNLGSAEVMLSFQKIFVHITHSAKYAYFFIFFKCCVACSAVLIPVGGCSQSICGHIQEMGEGCLCWGFYLACSLPMGMAFTPLKLLKDPF